MTDTPVPDVRKIIADELWDSWNFPSRGVARQLADAVLAAVEPVIRRQVAEEIAWAIEHPIGPQEVRWAPIARRWMAESAAIARSHSTREEQDHE